MDVFFDFFADILKFLWKFIVGGIIAATVLFRHYEPTIIELNAQLAADHAAAKQEHDDFVKAAAAAEAKSKEDMKNAQATFDQLQQSGRDAVAGLAKHDAWVQQRLASVSADLAKYRRLPSAGTAADTLACDAAALSAALGQCSAGRRDALQRVVQLTGQLQALIPACASLTGQRPTGP
jgi:hypothetical protein